MEGSTLTFQCLCYDITWVLLLTVTRKMSSERPSPPRTASPKPKRNKNGNTAQQKKNILPLFGQGSEETVALLKDIRPVLERVDLETSSESALELCEVKGDFP